jgi:TM2 domain-containing membrane protein YozV
MSKFCPGCGIELENPNAIACPNCGGAIGGRYNRSLQEHKSEGLAAVLSFLIPGLGQIYNGQIEKGIIFIILTFICYALTLILIGLLFYPILLVVAVFDAYNTAQKINREGFADDSVQF